MEKINANRNKRQESHAILQSCFNGCFGDISCMSCGRNCALKHDCSIACLSLSSTTCYDSRFFFHRGPVLHSNGGCTCAPVSASQLSLSCAVVSLSRPRPPFQTGFCMLAARRLLFKVWLSNGVANRSAPKLSNTIVRI